MWPGDLTFFQPQRAFCLSPVRKELHVPVRLSRVIVMMIGALLLSSAYNVMAKASGWAEVEIEAKADPVGQASYTTTISHSVSWQSNSNQLRLPGELELKWSRKTEASFSLEKGELILKPADYELRLLQNMGFRSTLDPMRLLSSSRRASGASGLEFRGTFGPIFARGLWLSQVDNVGDDGPMLLLDMSLDTATRGGEYRYVYLQHDSGWNWHFPKTGSYVTRTARQIHSLMGSWNVVPRLEISAQMTALTGSDVRKTYRRDLQGFAVLLGAEGGRDGLDWSLDVYRTNQGFLLATGDADSPGAGRQGLRGHLVGRRHRDESFAIVVQHDIPVHKLETRQVDAPVQVLPKDPQSQMEITYRRRTDTLNYMLGLEWETEARNPKILWETKWAQGRLEVGGRFGGTGNSQAYSRLSLHPLINTEVRWDPSRRLWRTAVRLQGLQSRLLGKETQWEGECVYKKRPGEAYTYLVLQHKMEKGYWEISWGYSDRGHLDWAWDEKPQINIRVGRYF